MGSLPQSLSRETCQAFGASSPTSPSDACVRAKREIRGERAALEFVFPPTQPVYVLVSQCMRFQGDVYVASPRVCQFVPAFRPEDACESVHKVTLYSL